MKRVMVLGGPGSGKSTLAVALGHATGLPVFHMDKIHWQSGWVERARTEKVRLVNEVETADQWILEGGLSATYDNRAHRADTAIWIDLPLPLRLFRVLKRRWQYRGGQTRPDLPENCPERLDPAFLHWILFLGPQNRKKIVEVLAKAPHLTVHHLKSRRDVSVFLSGLAT